MSNAGILSILLFLSISILSISTTTGENISEQAVIMSIIYDIGVDENRYDGFSLLTLKAKEDLDEIRFHSNADIELITDGLRMESKNDEIVISGLNLKKGDSDDIILKFIYPVSDHNTEIPLFQFPYSIEKTMIAVQTTRNKFIWNIGFPAYSLDGSDQALAQDGITEEEISQLNSDFLQLRDLLSKNSGISKYRIYLTKIPKNEKVTVTGWIGKGYEYYIPQIILVGLLSIILFSVFYFLSRRSVSCSEIEESGISGKELLKEKEVGWEEKMPAYEEILNRLGGDEQIIYQELLNSKGEILQKNLPEKTGFSKAKVTRVLDRLDQKKLIERRSYGITNKVVLR